MNDITRQASDSFRDEFDLEPPTEDSIALYGEAVTWNALNACLQKQGSDNPISDGGVLRYFDAVLKNQEEGTARRRFAQEQQRLSAPSPQELEEKSRTAFWRSPTFNLFESTLSSLEEDEWEEPILGQPQVFTLGAIEDATEKLKKGNGGEEMRWWYMNVVYYFCGIRGRELKLARTGFPGKVEAALNHVHPETKKEVDANVVAVMQRDDFEEGSVAAALAHFKERGFLAQDNPLGGENA